MKNINDFLSEKKDETKAHHTKKGEGADDKRYIRLAEKYKRTRGRDEKKAAKLFKELRALAKDGDVSKDAKLAATYI